MIDREVVEVIWEKQEGGIETVLSQDRDDASARLFSELNPYPLDNHTKLASFVTIEPRLRQVQDSSAHDDNQVSDPKIGGKSSSSDFFTPRNMDGYSGEIQNIHRQLYSGMNKDLLLEPTVVDYSNFDMGDNLVYTQPPLQSCFQTMREASQEGKADYEKYGQQRTGMALFLSDEQIKIPKLDKEQYQVLGKIQDALAGNDFSALSVAYRQLREFGNDVSRAVVVKELNEELSGFGLAVKLDKKDLVFSDGTYSLRLGLDSTVAKVAFTDTNKILEIEPKYAVVGLTNQAKFAKRTNDINGLDLINVHRKR